MGRFRRYRCSTLFNYHSNLSMCCTFLQKSIHLPDNRRSLVTPKKIYDLNLSAVTLSIWSFQTPTSIFCTKELYNPVFFFVQPPSPFTRHFIEFVVVETNQIVSSNSNVILMRQTCGQRPGMAAGGKRRAPLGFYFSGRALAFFTMFLIPKCRGLWDLVVCMTSGLTKRMRLRSADFRFLNVFGRKIRQNSPLRSGTLFASPEVMHRPRSHSPLHFDYGNI